MLHQIIVPGAGYFDVRGSAQIDGLDQIVIDVGIDAGLAEGINRRYGRATANEPGFLITQRRAVELAGFPDQITMTADKVGRVSRLA